MKYFYRSGVALLMLLMSIVNADAQSCQAAYTYTASGNTASFTDTSVPGTGSIVSWTWDFGDGNFDNVQNPSHSYAIGGQYIVTLNIFTTAFCFDSFTDTVTVNGGCTASYTYSVDTTNGQVDFQAAPLSQNLSYSWDFGDNTNGSGAFTTHYYAPGTYIACLMIADTAGFCSDTICDTIVVSGSCNAGFTYSVDTTSGQVAFQAQPIGQNFSYSWNFGDNSTGTGPAPTHTYAASGTYYVCLAVNDSAGFCNDTICDTVTVNIVPPNCNTTFNFTDQGDGNTSFTVSPFSFTANYDWDFGDNNIGQGGFTFHQYASPGTYYVCLTTTDGTCISTYCDSVTVAADTSCPLSFTYFANGLDVGFTATPFQFSSNVGYMWDFGDNSTAIGSPTSHSYAVSGTYWVCVTMFDQFNGCNVTYCDSVMVDNTGVNEINAGVSNLQSYPNPFNASTIITFTLTAKENVEVAVFDLLGNKVAVIVNGEQAAGAHRIDWNAGELGSGVYMLKITSSKGAAAKLLVKE